MALNLKLRRKNNKENLLQQFEDIFIKKELQKNEKRHLRFAIPRI